MPNINDTTTITAGSGNPPAAGLANDLGCIEYTSGAVGVAPLATQIGTPAGSGACWYYHQADTTWYREY